MMARRHTEPEWDRSESIEFLDERRPLSWRVGTFVLTVFVLGVLLYAAALVITRTQGFRALVTDRLEQRLDLPLTVGAAKMDWNLDLVIADLRTAEDRKLSRAGFELDSARLRVAPLAGLTRAVGFIEGLELTGGRLSLVVQEDGSCDPAVCAPLVAWLAQWGGLDGIGDATPVKAHARADPPAGGRGGKATGKAADKAQARVWDFWARIPMTIRDGQVTWWSRTGTKLAWVEGIDLTVTPVSLPERKLSHYRASLAKAEAATGQTIRNLRFELLSTIGSQIVLGFSADGWTAGPGGDASADEEPRRGRGARVPALKTGMPGERAAEAVVVEAEAEDFAERMQEIRKVLEDALAEQKEE